MFRLFPLLVIAFKVWLMLDVSRRRMPNHWYYIIALVPFGGLVYFLSHKIHDYKLGAISSLFSRPPSLDEVRYRAETSPSLVNNISLGQALHDHGRYDEAISQFNKILAQYPSNSEALHGYGACHVALCRFGDATPFLERVVEIDPGYLDYQAWTLLAQAHWENGDRGKSLEWLRRLVKLNPRPDHQLLLVRCLARMGQNEEAKSIIEKALRDYEHSPSYAKKSYRAVASEMRKIRKGL